MTSTLVKLHRTLWWRMVKANAAIVMMALLMAFYALLGLFSTMFLVWADLDSATGSLHALTAAAAAGMLGYGVMAVTMPAGENQLDASSLATLPLSKRDVVPALGLSALLGTRPVIAAVVNVLFAIVGSILLAEYSSAWAILAFLPAVALGFVSTVALGECIGQLGIASGAVKKEKLRSLAGIGVGLMVLAVTQLPNLFDDAVPLGVAGKFLAWTPLGACIGWAASFAEGAIAAGLAQLLIALATLAGMAWLWLWGIGRQFARPLDVGAQEASGNKRGSSPLVEGGVAARGPAAAEYVRSLLYLVRDSRMLTSFASIPILGVWIVVLGAQGKTGMMLWMVIVIAAMSTLAATNDFGYDGPATWVKVAAPVRPRTLMMARHLAHLTPPFVFTFLLWAAAAVVAPDKGLVLLLLPAVIGVFISSAAFALLLSAFNAYPMSRPGTNPWSDKAGYSASAFIAALVSMLIGWWPAVPGGVLMAMGNGRSTALLVAGVVVVILVPAVIYGVAQHLSSKRADSAMPEIFAKVGTWVE